ncbi:hypothetical protein GFK13_23285, partial [Salmonella enterica subsp. enterica serovar Enteritidis]|nr:hypothetical protein [Salmonella enterica subsp. enterica serovar Enteritidis]
LRVRWPAVAPRERPCSRGPVGVVSAPGWVLIRVFLYILLLPPPPPPPPPPTPGPRATSPTPPPPPPPPNAVLTLFLLF